MKHAQKFCLKTEQKRPLVSTGCRRNIRLKAIVPEQHILSSLDSSGYGQGPVVGFPEHGDKHSCSMNDPKIIDQLWDY
jgi:hypothetical protein